MTISRPRWPPTPAPATWGSLASAPTSASTAPPAISSWTRRWPAPCTWLWAARIPRPAASTTRRCTGTSSATCATGAGSAPTASRLWRTAPSRPCERSHPHLLLTSRPAAVQYFQFAMRRTKIVATIGPASRDPDTLARMVEAGLDVARLNFSHGSAEEHAETARLVRDAAGRAGRQVAILQDLPGPKLRIGKLR